jgi:hypothetical protein
MGTKEGDASSSNTLCKQAERRSLFLGHSTGHPQGVHLHPRAIEERVAVVVAGVQAAVRLYGVVRDSKVGHLKIDHLRFHRLASDSQ